MALRAMDARLDIRRPSLDEPLPKTLADHDGVVVFGGPMGANDNSSGSGARSTGSMCRSPRRSRSSASVSARRCWRARSGPACSAYEDKRSEIGYVPIEPNAAADRLCAERVSRAASTSGTPTASTCPRAPNCSPPEGKDFPNQAYRYGRRAVGLQFHPEVTYHMMCRWTMRGAERLTRPGAQAAPAPSRRLVPARRTGRRLARSLSARLAGRAARRGGGRRQPARAARGAAAARGESRPAAGPPARAFAPRFAARARLTPKAHGRESAARRVRKKIVAATDPRTRARSA